jgi:hypothetical protein
VQTTKTDSDRVLCGLRSFVSCEHRHFGTPGEGGIPVAARPKAWVCGRSLAETGGSNPPEACMSFSCERCTLSGIGFCDGPIPRPENSYKVCVNEGNHVHQQPSTPTTSR